MHLKGPVFSIPMFFEKTGEVDYKSLQGYLEEVCSSSGVSAIYSMAYNTRYMQLSFEEVVAVNKLVCQIANHFSVPAIIGHPINLTSNELREYCRVVKAYNPFAISVLYPERYFNIDEQVIEYHSIPNEFGLRLLIHEMKLISGFNGELINWNKSLLSTCMDIPGCIGLKEDSKDDKISSFALELSLDNQQNMILAGGGKRRLIQFLDEGLHCWLNGSLMLHPNATRKITKAIFDRENDMIQHYMNTVETPYFDDFISKVGWHVGHKCALHLAGKCGLYERAPMPTISADEFKKYKSTVLNVIKNLRTF
jgi:dihydrodipicolinate synthase/N-acetylneuraminate lyase